MVAAVLFDIGGVLTTSPFEAFNRYEAEAGLPADTIRRLNATDPDTNAWARFERSEIGVDEFCERFEAEAAAAGHRLDARAVLDCLAGDVRPAMVTAVARCAERVATAALTNNFVRDDAGGVAPQGAHEVARLAEVYELFDVVVESRLVGFRKPDERFYRHALELLGVTATDCVFLDDLGVNLKPARAMGMTTIKVTDPDVALDQLEAAVGFAVR